MPELPEVEIVRRMIEPVLLGQRVKRLRIHRPTLRYPIPEKKIRSIAKSGKIQSVGRFGKYLLAEFPAGTWVIHLGMSGNIYKEKPNSKHIHFEISTNKGRLFYTDPRRFGFFDAVDAGQDNPHFQNKGPDALTDCPDGEALFQQSRKLRSNVKSFLMDQSRLSGVGNIYASEIMHLARIAPGKAMGRLTRKNCNALSKFIPKVLREAIRHCGTTFDSFRTPAGKRGDNFQFLAVYNKAGTSCSSCSATIKKITQSNRSTYYCPGCQRS